MNRGDQGGPGVSPSTHADQRSSRPDLRPVGLRGPDGFGDPALHHHAGGTPAVPAPRHKGQARKRSEPRP
eukprot:541186-Alexandrium_andersonii.AAC.1